MICGWEMMSRCQWVKEGKCSCVSMDQSSIKMGFKLLLREWEVQAWRASFIINSVSCRLTERFPSNLPLN